MTRRGHKTRTTGVYRLKDGRWIITATQRHEGRTRSAQRTLPSHLGRAEVEHARASLRLELRSRLRGADEREGGPKEVKHPATTTKAPPPRPATGLGDFAERWIARKAQEWRTGTLDDNVRVLSHHVLPVLGNVPLHALERRHVLAWRAWAEEQRMADGRPYANASLAHWWRVLRSLLNDAIADHDLNPNLTFRVRAPWSPRRGVREGRALTAERALRAHVG